MINNFISQANKFISELSPLGKKLLAVAVLIIIVTLFDRLLVAPTMSRLNTIEEETAKEQNSKILQFVNVWLVRPVCVATTGAQPTPKSSSG